VLGAGIRQLLVGHVGPELLKEKLLYGVVALAAKGLDAERSLLPRQIRDVRWKLFGRKPRVVVPRRNQEDRRVGKATAFLGLTVVVELLTLGNVPAARPLRPTWLVVLILWLWVLVDRTLPGPWIVTLLVSAIVLQGALWLHARWVRHRQARALDRLSPLLLGVAGRFTRRADSLPWDPGSAAGKVAFLDDLALFVQPRDGLLCSTPRPIASS